MQDAMLAVAGDVPPVAIDVGANIGHHSLFLSRSASRVIAVEPYPPVRERMRALLDANGVTNVEIHPVGYSDQPGMLPFHEPTSANTGVGSFSTDRATGSQATRELPLVRGDDDLSGLPAAHLIKIDIEGFEKQALAGLTHTLSASRPAVMIELNVSGAAGFHNEQELRAALPPRYTFFRISTPLWLEWELPSSRIVCAPGRKNYLLTPYDMTFDHDGYNLLALPDEHRLALASHIR